MNDAKMDWVPPRAKQEIRFVVLSGGKKYLRAEDVAAFIREIGGAEETDVRNRLEEAARKLETPGE